MTRYAFVRLGLFSTLEPTTDKDPTIDHDRELLSRASR